jgi:hypothetical protein
MSISNIDGAGAGIGTIEIAIYGGPGNGVNTPTSSDGEPFTLISSTTGYSASYHTVYMFGRILNATSAVNHTVTWTTQSYATEAKQMKIHLLGNPMNIPLSDLQYRSCSYTGVYADFHGLTTYFPDCSDLRTSGAARLDTGYALRVYSDPWTGSGYTQQGFSNAVLSWDTSAAGYGSSPYFNYTNGNGTSTNTSGSNYRAIEDIGRQHNNLWSTALAPSYGKIPYLNKCYNYVSSSYVQLDSFLAGFSIIVPNNSGPQLVV